MKDVNNLHYCIKNILENINPYKIVVIANIAAKETIEKIKGIEFLDEDSLIENLTLSKIRNIMENKIGTSERSGWYFQQFLKIAYAYKCQREYYLIWDSDTIPLNKIIFWNNNGKCLFTMKTEYHVPYFETINKLFCGKITKSINKSFIAEHMMINKDCMLNMLTQIESNKMLQGIKFYEKIMDAITKEDMHGAGFSEFETYGSYILTYYPHLYNTRELRMFRDGSMLINKDSINSKTLKWISRAYDAISFEKHLYYDKIPKLFQKIFKFIVLYRILPFKVYRYCYDLVKKIFKKQ